MIRCTYSIAAYNHLTLYTNTFCLTFSIRWTELAKNLQQERKWNKIATKIAFSAEFLNKNSSLRTLVSNLIWKAKAWLWIEIETESKNEFCSPYKRVHMTIAHSFMYRIAVCFLLFNSFILRVFVWYRKRQVQEIFQLIFYTLSYCNSIISCSHIQWLSFVFQLFICMDHIRV